MQRGFSGLTASGSATTAQPVDRAGWCVGLLIAALVLVGGGGSAAGQIQNPVYVDDAPSANETLARVPSLLATGNDDEAARVLQVLLTEDGERVVATSDRNLFESVRSRVHRVLRSDPGLLERYRTIEGVQAERLFEAGDIDTLERTRLLTPPGFDSAVRLAQGHLEGARFNAARMTLEQLTDHPDAQGERLVSAGRLLADVACYLDDPETADLAAGWLRDAGVEVPAFDAARWPDAARLAGHSALDHGESVLLQGILPKPLWSLQLDAFLTRAQTDDPRFRNDTPQFGRQLAILPTVAGDTLYVNDGQMISALNRFTLEPKWQVTPSSVLPPSPAPQRTESTRFRRSNNPRAMLEDPSTITVASGTVVATTGRPVSAGRLGDDRVHALEARDGTLRWSVRISDLHPDLEGTAVRGPAIIADGTVVVGLRKSLIQRRLYSVYLVGIDLQTGALRWQRLMGSAGSLPHIRQSLATHGGVERDGVVYRSERLGVLGAYEAATGRPRWVRRTPSQPVRMSVSIPPWQISLPILDGETLIALAPDESPIYRLDRATGRILGTRAGSIFGTPRYLVRVGDKLAGVGDDRIYIGPIDSFEIAGAQRTPDFPDLGIRGRVVAAGDRLLVPLETGVAIVDPSDPTRTPEMLPLDAPGNVLAEQGQLAVVDDSRIHSYLLWDEAESRLKAQMLANASDPRPGGHVRRARISRRTPGPDPARGRRGRPRDRARPPSKHTTRANDAGSSCRSAPWWPPARRRTARSIW